MPEDVLIVKFWVGSVLFILVFGFGCGAQACIWDSKTLAQEKQDHPTLAEAILHPKANAPDLKGLEARVQELTAKPNTNDPAWWNDLAGAYLRMGQPQEAVKLLEQLRKQFANDYGLHANLGTAYHLLGRYAEAEREIRRDTEINTNAHFGLEKYHLALLQYLIRDKNYQFRHFYVDEFSIPVFETEPARIMLLDDFSKNLFATHKISRAEAAEDEKYIKKRYYGKSQGEWEPDDRDVFFQLVVQDEQPQYRQKWDLGADPKLDDGVIYMATLNPKEPACWAMLGLVAGQRGDYNLAKTAFDRAIKLGSPQAPILRWQIKGLKEYLAHQHNDADNLSASPLPDGTAKNNPAPRSRSAFSNRRGRYRGNRRRRIRRRLRRRPLNHRGRRPCRLRSFPDPRPLRGA